MYRDSNKSCRLYFKARVVNVSVDELENRALNHQWNAREANIYDTYSATLKFPVLLRRYNENQDSDDGNAFLSFFSILKTEIMSLQWKKILHKNPNRYHCSVCAKPAVTLKALASPLEALAGPLEFLARSDFAFANGFGVLLMPCFTICESGARCQLTVRKCIDKYFTPPVCVGGSCANCGKHGHDSETERKLLICARCKAIFYCNPECQKEHWPVHKQACKLVTCQKCGKMETSTKFPKCARCQKVFYCGRDCQSADWVDHKNSCNAHSR
jgi:hypothetical protein